MFYILLGLSTTAVVVHLMSDDPKFDDAQIITRTHEEVMSSNPNVKSKLMINANKERPVASGAKRSPASEKKKASKKKRKAKANISESKKIASRSNYNPSKSYSQSYDPDIHQDITIEEKKEITRKPSTVKSDSDSLGYGGDIGVGSVTNKSGDSSEDEPTITNDVTTSGGVGESSPEIVGTVPPLLGSIVNNSSFIFNDLHAATCSSPSVQIFDLESMTVLADNPIGSEGLGITTAFEFNPTTIGVDLQTPTRYMLRTTGCTENFERIITSFYRPQPLGPATTLMSKSIYSAITVPYADIDPISFLKATEKLESITANTDDLNQAYTNLTGDADATTNFTATFGVSPSVLAEAAPKIDAHVIPTTLAEKTAGNFSVTAFHWNPTYTVAYEWYIDSVLISNLAATTYTPSANSKNNAQLEVFVGMKNAGDSNVDRTKPFHNFTVTIPVTDDFPVTSPTFALNAGSNDPTNTLGIGLDLSTGTFAAGVYPNCETFSNFAVTENSTTPVIGDFVNTCTAGAVQVHPHTLVNTADGTITLKLWGRDQRGLISAAELLPITLDRTNPVISYSGIQANYRADRTTTFNWNLTEVNASGAQNFTLQFYDGSAWSALPNVSVTGGVNSATAYSTSFLLPNLNTTSAQLRISYTDLAGNSVTADSVAFGIQAPILGMTPNPNDYGSILNKAQSGDATFTIANTGLVAADNCSVPALSGTNASEFSISTDNCGTSDLSAAGNCTVFAKAIPDTKGAKSATLSWTCGSDVISTALTYTSANNQPTSAGAATVTTNEDTPLSFSVSAGSDIDLVDTLTYSIVSTTSNGVLSNCMASDTDLTCDYSPSLNFNGTDSFIYRVHDGTAFSAANTTVTITVNPINDAPTVTSTQSVATDEDTLVAFNLNNGADVDLDTLTYIVVSTPSNGTLTCTGGTSDACSYTPDLNYNGTDTFTYKVSDSLLDSNIATVTININSLNDAPVMVGNQVETTLEDTLVSFTLAGATDIDIPAQTLSYKIITPPSNGVVTNCIGTVSFGTDVTCDYTPNANYNGSDSFTYKSFDGTVESSTAATVTLTITAVNDAPTLTATQSQSTNEDVVLNFNLGVGTDIESDPLTYSVVSTTTNGTLSCTGGASTSCSYTPDANFNGADSFTYKTNDGALDSNTATVNITVNPVNDAPTLVTPQAESTNEDTLLSFNLGIGTDIDLDSLTYSVVSTTSNGVLSCTGGASRACTYMPSADFNGADSFTYKTNDGSLDSNTATVNITVVAVNDAPTVATPQSQSTNEDIVLNFNLGTGSDTESDPLSYIVVATTSNGTLSCTGGTSTACSYTPNLNYNGSDSFTYKVNDGGLDSNIATVNITVSPINDAPTVVTPQAQSTNEDVVLGFNLGIGTDVDLDTLSYIVVSTTTNGSLSCTGGTSQACTYTPNLNYNGSDSFTYKTNDGALDSNTATVNITVNSINDAPVVVSPQAASTNEDIVLNFNLGTASDVDGDAQTYIVVATSSNGTLSCTGGASTACTYTPNTNFNGPDSFTYKSNDGTADSNIATFNITVNPINDAPTVVATQAQSTDEDTPKVFLLGIGSDVEGDTLTYSIVSTPTNGGLSCVGGTSQTCTYTPNLNYNGADSFTYKVNDGALDSNIGTVNFTVNSINDAPVLASPQSKSTNEDVALSLNFSAATDVDGDAQTYTIVSTTTNGALSCTGGASTACTYTPNANYNGADSFTYKSNDGTVDSNTATVNITVNAVNDIPTLVTPQSQSTNEDVALTNFNLGIGSDIDLDTLTYIIVTTPSNGSLSCTGGTSRVCTYTPNLNYNGSDSFTYKVNDGTADSTAATVNLTINPVNDAPVLASPQSKSTNEDTLLSFNFSAATDVDGDAQTYSVVSTTTNGTLSCTGGASTACTYTPNANYNGADSFTYKSNDSVLDSNTATVNITVNAVNDIPTLVSPQAQSTNEDVALTNFSLGIGSDIDGDSLTYIVVASPINGSLSCTGGTSRLCTYTPDANYNGADSFTYKVNDGTADSTAATVNLTINPVNDAPTVVATQAQSTNEDVVLNFNLGIGTDIDGDTLTYSVVATSTNGTLSCTGGTSRACTYTPNANYNGSDSFTYRVNDGALNSNTATVNLTINAINDRPVMVANQSFTVDDNTASNITLSGATDIDLPAQTISYKVISAPTNGTLSNCITTGSYLTDITCTYTANTNYNGTDSFTYLANDSLIDSIATKTVTYTVSDKTPPAAPAVARSSALYTQSTASTYTASSCADTPFIFFNEGTAPTAGAAGWQACTTTASALTYTLSAGNGTKSVRVWSKDPNGNVSTASTPITIYYDTTAPTLAITTPTIRKGGSVYSVAWTMTEVNSSTAQSFSVDFFNGSTWSNGVATKAALNGPLTTQAFNVNYTLPSLNVTTAKFRVNFTDLAGNASSVQTASFEIDSIAPSIAISTPAASSYHQASLTMTGTCETGADVNFSGAIQASFSLTCSGGSFSQLLNLSDFDGNKAITLTHTDPAGNQSTTSRTFIRDEVAPILTKTSGANPGFTGANNFSWGGTCEGNYTINVTGAQTTSFACSAGTWSWTTGDKLVDGTFSYNLAQTDAAGNISTALTLSWERDGTPPPFTMASPVSVASGGTGALTSNGDTVSVSGNCEGTNSIAITGAAASAVSCSSGSWSWTSPTVSTDALRSYVFTQSDSAGNTSVVTLNWTRDTTGPALTLTSNLEKTNTATVTFSGGCENGLTINITGAQTSTATCTTGLWSWTSAVQSTDATRAYTFKQTNAVPNTTTVNASWIRETNVPTISSLSTSALNPTKNANIPISMAATSQNANVFLSHLCMKTDDTVQPSPGDSCWVAINGPAVGLPLSQTLSLNEEFYHLLGWTPNITLTAYAWVMDEAENVSDLTSAGAGTNGVDKFDRVYDPGQPPVVSDVIAANIHNSPNPPTRAQAEVPAGSDVYVRWIATDNFALPAGAVSIYYSTDEINFTQVGGAEALDHGVNHGCTGITLLPNEGCFKWTGGSPLNISYKIRVKVTDATSISSQMISNPLNSGLIKIIAGNTEAGLGGSAVTAMFFTRKAGGESDPGTLVVTDDGKVYFNDYKRGILTVDPNDGKQKVFIPNTGTSSGDGGPAVNATLKYATKMALDFQNRLIIMDTNRIRRVNLNETTPSIETIIGGGAQTTDTVVNPLDLSIYSHSTNSWTARGMVFFATPNGDIYFHSDYALKNPTVPTFRLRKFNSATGQIESKYLTGNGDGWEPAKDLLKCRVMNPGLQYDPGTSQITGVTVINNSHTSYVGCDTADSRYSRSYFDPNTFQTLPTQLDDSYRYYRYFHITGMDGNTYVIVDRNYVNRVNFDGSYTRVLGSGTRGHCDDGTPNTSCNMDIQDMFISTTGKIYYTDRGQIRTIDSNGNVVTLFGQNPGYGDGVNALNSRFDLINTLARLDNGKILVADPNSYYMKEFTIEGDINVIAGNGNYQVQNTSTVATSQGFYDGTWWLADKMTGDVYARRQSDTYIGKLNRSTNKWEDVVGTGVNEYWNNDGQPGLSSKSGGNQRYSLPIGFDSTTKKLLLSHMRYNSVETHWEDFMLKEYDGTDLFRQSHVAGTNDPLLTYVGGYNSICADGTSTATCKMPYWDTWGLNNYWDADNNRWILMAMHRNPEREVYSITPGGTVNIIANIPRNVDNSALWFKEGGTTNVAYYCTGGRIYKHNIDTNADLGALPWQIGNMYCRGYKMDYNPTNNSIIFPFEQNGLYGVGEYFLP